MTAPNMGRDTDPTLIRLLKNKAEYAIKNNLPRSELFP